MGARVGVAAPAATASAADAGALVREVAAVVEPVADALPGDAGAVPAAGRVFNGVVRFLPALLGLVFNPCLVMSRTWEYKV